MNYCKARERKDADGNPSGIWDYTRKNDDQVWPVGYCAGWKEWTEWDEKMVPGLLKELEERRPFKRKFHTDGHPTAEEAYRCKTE